MGKHITKKTEQGEPRPDNIFVRVIDENEGLQVLTNVCAVRIRSKEYVLLLMSDYTPTLGKVDGSVTFVLRDREVEYRDIEGYYKLQHNEFTLLVKKDRDPQ